MCSEDLESNHIYYLPRPISSNIPISIEGWYDENSIVFKTYDESDYTRALNTIIMDISEDSALELEHQVEISRMD